jgi:hypothetical protein
MCTKRIYKVAGMGAGLSLPYRIAYANQLSGDFLGGQSQTNVVSTAFSINAANSNAIVKWIEGLSTFILVVYVLLMVSTIILGAFAISTGGGSGALMGLLKNIPFIGDSVAKNATDSDPLEFAKKMLLSTFKTTLVVVLAWASVRIIISIALWVASNMAQVTSETGA